MAKKNGRLRPQKTRVGTRFISALNVYRVPTHVKHRDPKNQNPTIFTDGGIIFGQVETDSGHCQISPPSPPTIINLLGLNIKIFQQLPEFIESHVAVCQLDGLVGFDRSVGHLYGAFGDAVGYYVLPFVAGHRIG